MDLLPARQARPVSERIYQLLLLAYPRAFREEYASEMLLTFRDAYREASRGRSALGVLAFWADLLSDFVKSVYTEHASGSMARDDHEVVFAAQEPFAMALPFSLCVAQHTDIGRVRVSNEDNLISVAPDDRHLAQVRGALFVVSDGMGDRGSVASELVIQQVRDHYFQNLQDDLPTALQKAVGQAGEAILRAKETDRIRGAGGSEMGATCVAAVVHGWSLYVANVGDSRGYVLHAGHLRQVTRDHSLVAQMVERGELTVAEARAHPKRNIIYRALGASAILDAEADLFIEPIQEGDTIILCTDGLCGVVDDEELRVMVEHFPPDESVQRLIARANARGGPDNVTAIVVRVSASA